MSENEHAISDELFKALHETALESLIYGRAFMIIGSDGSAMHIPFKEVINTVKEIDSLLHESVKLIQTPGGEG